MPLPQSVARLVSPSPNQVAVSTTMMTVTSTAATVAPPLVAATACPDMHQPAMASPGKVLAATSSYLDHGRRSNKIARELSLMRAIPPKWELAQARSQGGGTVYGRHSLGSTGVRIIGDPIAPNSIRNRGEHVRALKGEGKEHMSKMVTLGLIFLRD